MKDLQELMKSKKGKGMSDEKMSAKMCALKDLRSMANGLLGDDLKSLKKVTVASDTPEGLEAGLEKAEEIVETQPEEMKSEGTEEPSEEYEEEMPQTASHYEQMMEMVSTMSDEEKAKLLEMLQS
jgi:hypothetical protein